MVAGMAAVTFGVRYPVLALLSRSKLPDVVLQALQFVPAAVLSAIVVLFQRPDSCDGIHLFVA